MARYEWTDHDVETLLLAAQYGNPPAGWSDPDRRRDFERRVAKIEERLRENRGI